MLNPKHIPVCEADRIPVGNEAPYSVSLEDLYHQLAGIRDAMGFIGEPMLEAVFEARAPHCEAIHTTFEALMEKFCTTLKALRFAAEIATVRGCNHIANDAWFFADNQPADK